MVRDRFSHPSKQSLKMSTFLSSREQECLHILIQMYHRFTLTYCKPIFFTLRLLPNDNLCTHAGVFLFFPSGRHWTGWEHRRTGTYRTKGTFVGVKLLQAFHRCNLACNSLFLDVISGRAGTGGRTWSSWSRWTQGDLFFKIVLILLDKRYSYCTFQLLCVHSVREKKATWVRKAATEIKVKLG